MLGEALASGRGYREIDKPDAPRHAHFPPGYPAALALIWRFFGRSVAAAHAFSMICTVAAVVLAWLWFHTLYRPRIAFLLGLALALNWTWTRNGGSIQSEPLFLLSEMLAIHLAVRAGGRDRITSGVMLGICLGACVLIRHVGVCIGAAVITDLALGRRWRALRAAVLSTVLIILPWAVWLLIVREHTQAGLLVQDCLATRVLGQAIFYIQRLPDQISGPLVEVGTVFHRSTANTAIVNLWAVAASATIAYGWLSTLKSSRRRLAGLTAMATLALLLVWPFTEAGRFLVPVVPFLLVGATEGLARILSIARTSHPRVWSSGMVLAASIPYAIYASGTGRAEAQRQTHADFDAACAWLTQHASRPGPVVTRYPGELYWQTGRLAVAAPSTDPESIDRLIDRLAVAYMLIDEDRFAQAAVDPLALYVDRYPGRSTQLWIKTRGTASIQIRQIVRPD